MSDVIQEQVSVPAVSVRLQDELSPQIEAPVDNFDFVQPSDIVEDEACSEMTTPQDYQRRSSCESQIRATLNQQTINQFRQYAVEQNPKDTIKQEDLIRQLQEQHFQQYMNQVFKKQLLHQKQQIEQLQSLNQSKNNGILPGDEIVSLDHEEEFETEADETADSSDLLPNKEELLPIVPASLWTRCDIQDFKQNIYKESRDCCIKISSLAVATIRVPTHKDGSTVFWEFATDHYDIGFGVYFEWVLTPDDKVVVEISESDDEEDDETEAKHGGDVESGDSTATTSTTTEPSSKKKKPEIPTDELIPVYRRDSHLEIYCGSHQYPGRGVYILKFDNSYSLWRSKWLYYRVYYTR